MKLEIKYFGQVVEATNKEFETREIPASTSVTGLKHALESFYPKLEKVTYSIAVNQSMVNDEWVIENDCEIAVLPPFAGG
ncbi:MAG: MoaD/ThiS family protein [Salibacteraceae bacterium]